LQINGTDGSLMQLKILTEVVDKFVYNFIEIVQLDGTSEQI